jgi:hypothetical protein
MRAAGKFVGQANPYRCERCGGWHWGRSRGDRMGKAAQIIAAIDRAMERDRKRRQGQETTP